MAKRKLYLTAWKDGHMLPNGFVSEYDTTSGNFAQLDLYARFDLLYALLDSLGVADVQFSSTAGDATDKQPEEGYEEV